MNRCYKTMNNLIWMYVLYVSILSEVELTRPPANLTIH